MLSVVDERRCLMGGLSTTTLYDRAESYLVRSLTRIPRPSDRPSAYQAVFDGLRSSVHKRSPCRPVVEAGSRRSAGVREDHAGRVTASANGFTQQRSRRFRFFLPHDAKQSHFMSRQFNVLISAVIIKSLWTVPKYLLL